MDMYQSTLRPILRQLFVRICPGPIRARRYIAVVGLPRSGSSWIAKSISLAQGVSYYFEPDQRMGESYRYKYVPVDEQEGRLESHVKMAFRGRFVDEYTIAEQGVREILSHCRSRTVLIKCIFQTLSLEWLSKHFPEVTVVQIIRHPVPQFLSWRQRGWNPDYNLQLLLNQPKLMKGPLQPYASVMHKAETYWEKSGAFWGAIAHMQLRAHRPNWFLLEHEWYCIDARQRIRWLIEQLGLVWNEVIAEFLSPNRKILSGPGYGERRDPKNEIHKWEKSVKASELETLQNTLKYFNLPFYPGLNPEGFWMPTPKTDKPQFCGS